MHFMQTIRQSLRAFLVVVYFLLSLTVLGRELIAQVVQLPSVQQFGYSGAVSVPDLGDASLGGYRSARSGISGGPAIGGRTFGTQNNGGGLSVSATIIDLQAMDQTLLNQPIDAVAETLAGRSTGKGGATFAPQPYAGRAVRGLPHSEANDWQMALGSAGSPTGRTDSIAASDSDVRYYMLKAQQASDLGRIAAARVYYRMAYESMSETQRERLLSIQTKASQEKKVEPGQSSQLNKSQSVTPEPAKTSGKTNSRSF